MARGMADLESGVESGAGFEQAANGRGDAKRAQLCPRDPAQVAIVADLRVQGDIAPIARQQFQLEMAEDVGDRWFADAAREVAVAVMFEPGAGSDFVVGLRQRPE